MVAPPSRTQTGCWYQKTQTWPSLFETNADCGRNFLLFIFYHCVWISLYSVVRPHFVLQKRVKGKSKSCAPSGCQLIDLGRRSKREYPGDLHAPYCPLYKHRLGWGHLFYKISCFWWLYCNSRNTTGSGWSPFLNKYILFLIIKVHYVKHNKAFKLFWSVRL